MKKYIALFFLSCFSLLLLPKEFIHNLHHQDTEDIRYDHNGSPSIDHQHHHCKSLLLITPDLTGYSEVSVKNIIYPQTHSHTRQIAAQSVFILREFSRGPPNFIC